jgi:hypothetical protein
VDTSRISAFRVLADLPAAEPDELAAAMSEVEVDAGATVITADDYGTAVYFIFQRIRARVPELERSLRRLGVERAGR